MTTRRTFLLSSAAATLGTTLLPSLVFPMETKRNLGVQLYTFRKEMGEDPMGTLKKIASIGIKEIESAGSQKGYYYGLKPTEMKSACEALGMKLVSGHVQLDANWEQTMEDAVASGQEYLICSSMPSRGQNSDNYKMVARRFNEAGEACKKLGLRFGYHNHDFEFESDKGEVLYDILLQETDPDLVHMELDLGWVIAAGKAPLDYFSRFPGRFPLWHLKDMNLDKKESTEFGLGGLDIPAMMSHQEEAGVKHIFIEQEEYAHSPLESMKHNMAYMQKI